MRSLLGEWEDIKRFPECSTSAHLTPDELQDHFENKIEVIRVSTEDVPLPSPIINAKSRLIDCIREFQTWSVSMCLKLNASKTEPSWFDREPSSGNESPSKIMNIEADRFIVPFKVVRILGVFIDYQLTMVTHISSVIRASHFHRRRIRQVSVPSMNSVLKSCFKLSYYHDLTTAILLWLVFLKRLCSYWRLSYTLLHV